MSLFKGTLNSENEFEVIDLIRGLSISSPSTAPAFFSLEESDGTVQYFWFEAANLRMSETRPTYDLRAGGNVIAGASNSGASRALDNITSCAINVDLDPDGDGTRDLGDSSHVWAEGFVTKLVLYPTDCYFTGTSALATLTGALSVGDDSGTAYDVKFHGSTADQYLHWDESFASNMGGLILRDNVFLVFGDASTGDVTFEWNEATFEMDAPTDSTWNIGATNQFDVVFHGNTGGYDVMFDNSANAMVALDNAAFIVGTTAYIKIVADGTDIHIDGNTADKQVQWGAGNVLDLILHGATGNSDIFWDASEDTMFVLDNAIFSVGSGGDFNLVSTGTVTTGTFSGTTSGLILQSYADMTTAVLKLDGATGDWDGADDVGMLWLTNDVAHVDAGASSLIIADSSTPVVAAQGFMARFVHSGTARADSYGVSIEVPAVQQALHIDGRVVIEGQDSMGYSLLHIINNSGTDNQDGVTITTEGTGFGLKIESLDVDSVQFGLLAEASQTHSMAIIDGQSVDWIGVTEDKGMLHLIHGDTAMATDGATMLYVATTSRMKDGAEGTCARFLSTGTARADAAVVEIAGKDSTEIALNCSAGQVRASEFRHHVTTKIATGAGTGTGLVAVGEGFCQVTTTASDDNDILMLPAGLAGMIIWIFNHDTAQEFVITPDGTENINGLGNGTGSSLAEDYVCRLVCVEDGVWIGTKYQSDGTESKMA